MASMDELQGKTTAGIPSGQARQCWSRFRLSCTFRFAYLRMYVNVCQHYTFIFHQYVNPPVGVDCWPRHTLPNPFNSADCFAINILKCFLKRSKCRPVFLSSWTTTFFYFLEVRGPHHKHDLQNMMLNVKQSYICQETCIDWLNELHLASN